MLKREIYQSLVEWKADRERRPLLLRGARQVGKTYITQHFGNQEFTTFITLNLERNPEYKEIFSTLIPQEIIEKIALFTGTAIVPGKTLLFIDEIQEHPKAIMALRYFYEEMPHLHIIGAGSLLEFALQKENFRMPVGRIQFLYLYPLSFNEFLDAIGEVRLRAYLRTHDLASIPTAIHNKLLSHLRKYFILGGMPAVVNTYTQTKDVIACQKLQHIILETYKQDFSKYAKDSKFKYLRKIFNKAPTLIGQKFIYAKVDNQIKSRELKDALELLETAGVLTRVTLSSGAGIPLSAHTKPNFFKIIFLDIGLMQAASGITQETTLAKDFTAIYKGALAEQFVGQELLAYAKNYLKPKLFYWAREARSSSAEVDYLVEKDGIIFPIEIKSGSSGRLKSLLLFLQKHPHLMGLKISQAPYKKEDRIIALPLYGIEKFMNYTPKAL